jgi:hypothetical protein
MTAKVIILLIAAAVVIVGLLIYLRWDDKH